MYSFDIDLKLVRHISVVDISVRVPTQLHSKLSKTALTTPSLQSERPRHVCSVQQSTTSPNLAVVRPPLLNPLNLRMFLAKHVEHNPRARGSLALQQASLKPREQATTNEHESSTALLGLLDEVDFSLSHVVFQLMGSHQSDVQLRARLEVVLQRD